MRRRQRLSPALASRMAHLVERGAQGLFHIGGGAPISWFDWAVKIFAAAGVTPSVEAYKRTGVPHGGALRPKFSALSNVKMESAGDRCDAFARSGDRFVHVVRAGGGWERERRAVSWTFSTSSFKYRMITSALS